ncbi:G-D-S-L family lipolytic protein [Eudoraea sp.]|uniref:SGNH/GDSL hydrolase family protein n=1 Tax=Eudoraea sp. TaxID=1979955 RepID=UPI003C778877
MKKLLMLISIIVLLLGCNNDDGGTPIPPEPEIEYTSGSADFTTYVALGNSLTAGFSDSALFIDGQLASFPTMLASNFALAGGGEFTIPLMADNLGGLTLGGQAVRGNRLILDFSSGDPTPVEVEGSGATEISNTLAGPFNNLGAPGAKSYHLLAPGYGNVAGVALGLANPYYARFASSGTATIVGDALAQNPTFFSLWVGNLDALNFAIAGGDGIDQTGNLDPSTYGNDDISDPNVFAAAYDGILEAITANGAKGVIANLPDLKVLPYFTTVPFNPVPLDAATAGLLNGAYAAYNGGINQLASLNIITAEEAAARQISFSAGDANAVVLLDEDLTDLTGFNPALINMRQATAADLLVFTSQTIIGTLANPNDPTSINGVAVPLADKWVLTPEEQQIATQAAAAYNQTIEALAQKYDVAFVDAKGLLDEVNETGITLSDGSIVTSDYATGGGFSLDGIHPAPRGYALVANEMIEAINAKYGSNLPGVEPLDFTGLYIK